MERYALIGYPLGHSLSPQIHQRLFQLEGVKAEYLLDDFPPQALEAHLPILQSYAAFNITIPYKTALLDHLAGISENARLYGSVNAVQVREGRFYGDNTDCVGFLRTLEGHGLSLNTRVCVVGAGGVGRMFALEAARQGAQVTLAARASSLEKACQVAAEGLEKLGTQIRVQPLETLDGPFGLLINATPVGMYPKVDASPVPKALLEQVEAVFDCIYNPSQTLLLQWAKELGKPAVGGMGMLVWQAAAAHELWLGTRFSHRAIQQLIGEMERLLAEREGRP